MSDWIYTTNEKNTARFSLGRPGPRMLCCIGVNPSTAHPGKLDQTLTRVSRFARDKAPYEGWLMLNLYPQRATNPVNIHRRRQTALHHQNLEEIAALFRAYPGMDVWAAWGVEIERRPFLWRCLSDIVEAISEVSGPDVPWIHLGALTKAGHPRHPLYLPGRAEFSAYDIRGYLANASF
ncbi:MAG: DUF1643 domain-containing protein [Bacteroidota bacterium]